jgi:ATP-dependent exoDNAse (exonuclease V) beta subunit
VQDLTRLVSGWKLPAPPAAVAVSLDMPSATPATAIEFKWAGETARHVGTVVHRWLLRIGDDGLSYWNPTRIKENEAAFRLALMRLGVPAEELGAAVHKVDAALTSALADERARWLLDAHADARSEYALSGVLDGRVLNVVLDRTFVDNDGVRWIVDYKTSEHEGADVDAFLDSERARYRAQLERYARLLEKTESRPVKLGLYFPLLRGWREWEFQNI